MRSHASGVIGTRDYNVGAVQYCSTVPRGYPDRPVSNTHPSEDRLLWLMLTVSIKVDRYVPGRLWH
jgi:hypothetical protein